MALPATGPIDMGQVRTELGLDGAISLDMPLVRSLAGKATGIISMNDLRGKSAGPALLTLVSGQQSGTRGYLSANGKGSLSPDASYDGMQILSMYSMSGSKNTLITSFQTTTVPTYTSVIINGIAYPAFAASYKTDFAVVSTTVATGVYDLMTNPITVGFQ